MTSFNHRTRRKVIYRFLDDCCWNWNRHKEGFLTGFFFGVFVVIFAWYLVWGLM